MDGSGNPGLYRRSSAQLPDAVERLDELRTRFGALEGQALLRAMIRDVFAGRIAVVSSFGAESAVVLDLVAQVEPGIPVIFLETGKHFPETLAYRDRLVRHLGLRDLRIVRPDPQELAGGDPDGTLHAIAPDACCHLRKVVPLARALEGLDAWITGRKRYQGGIREDLPVLEAVDGRIKINPLANWGAKEVAERFKARNLPLHPLALEGYRSIGCATCTRKPGDDESGRSGRWPGFEKTECGIHRAPWYRD